MQNADFGTVKIHTGKYGAVPQAVMANLFPLMLGSWDASWHCGGGLGLRFTRLKARTRIFSSFSFRLKITVQDNGV